MATLKPSDYPFWLRLVVAITLLMFAVNLFFFLAPGIAFATWIGKAGITGKELLTGAGALMGSFVGAWFAFRFAQHQRKQEKDNGEVAAGNLALFTLTTMYNELQQHQKEIVEPYRGKADAWLNLHVSQPLNPNLRFEIKDLVFVMQADAAVFQQLLLEESRFQFAAYLIEEHRRLALVETWPRLEAAGLHIGDNRPENEIEAIIGVSVVHRLKITTDAIIKNIDEDVKSSLDAFVKLRSALKSIHPKRKFIDFKPA